MLFRSRGRAGYLAAANAAHARSRNVPEVAVTIRMKESKDTAADGLLAKEEINYALRLKTLSQCIELEPGCLKVREKKVFKTVSTKTPI